MNALSNYARITFKTLPLFFHAAPLTTTFVVGVLLFQGLIPAITLHITQQIIQKLTSPESLSLQTVVGLVAAWILVLLLDAILSPWLSVTHGRLNEKITTHVSFLLMRKTATLQGLKYFEDRQFYDQLQEIRYGATWRPMNLLYYFVNIGRQLLTIGGILLLLFPIEWWLPFVILLASIPQTFIVTRLRVKSYDAIVARTKEVREMHYYSSLLLSDTHAKEIRLFNLHDYFVKQYRAAFEYVFATTWGTRVRAAQWITLLTVFSALTNAVAFYHLVNQVLAGHRTAGDIVILIQALAYVQQNLNHFGEMVGYFVETLEFMGKLFRFLDLPVDLPLPLAPQQPSQSLQQEITFQNVSFTYPDGRTALHNFSITLRPGEVVAIVGENGAGKSTLVKLLARFYDPTEGTILIDNTPLPQLDLPRWREQMAVVFQDFNHYSLTLGENIGFEEADRLSEIEAAGTAAGMEAFVETLPQGYSTMLGKQFDGTELSGGQWQKIALARAFFRREKAQLLILDEPTAALDPRSEYELFQKFAALSAGQTTLLITHRLASVRMASRIIVLKHGTVIEDGTHEALIAQDGEYAALWDMQAKHYQS